MDGSATLDDVLQQTADAHPAPNEQAAQIVADVMSAGSATPLGAPTAGQLDRKGTPFDPTKNDGTLTARGTWRKRRRADAVGAQGATAAPDSTGTGGIESFNSEDIERIDTRAVAGSWLDMIFTVAPMMLGAAWEPSNEERGKLLDALERWMIASGITYDLPPGWALIGAVGVYAMGPGRLMELRPVRKMIDKTFKRKASDEDEAQNSGAQIAETFARAA